MRWWIVLAILALAVLGLLLMTGGPVSEEVSKTNPPSLSDNRIQPKSSPLTATTKLTEGKVRSSRDKSEAGIVFGKVHYAYDNQPAFEAAVYLFPFEVGFRKIEIWEGPKAKTDDQGHFSFEDVRPGRYRVLAEKNGLRSMTNRSDVTLITVGTDTDARVGPLSLFLQEGIPFDFEIRSLVGGKPIADAKILLPQMPHTFTHSDENGAATLTLSQELWSIQVSAPGYANQILAIYPSAENTRLVVHLAPGGAITGEVRDQDGNPVEDASVLIVMTAPEQVTDARGRFRIEGLPLESNLGFMCSKRGFSTHHENVLLSSEETEKNLIIELGPLAHSKTLIISGVVKNGEGLPLPGSKVTLLIERSYPEHITESTIANEKGQFSFSATGLSRSSAVFAEFPGYAPNRHDLRAIVQSGTDSAEIELVLDRGSWAAGIVIDEWDEPVADVSISPYWQGMKNFGGNTQFSDNEGRFYFDSLPDNVQFLFQKTGYSMLFHQNLPLQKDDVTVVLKEPGLIHGRVLDQDTGDPVTQYTITLGRRSSLPTSQVMLALANSGLVIQDKGGLFRLDELMVDGEYQFQFHAEGYLPESAGPYRAKSRTKAEPEEIVLKREGETIAGIVRDREGRGIAEANIHLLVASQRRSDEFQSLSWAFLQTASSNPSILQNLTTVTGTDGTFQFEEVHPDYPIGLFAHAEGFSRVFKGNLHKLPKKERHHIVLELQPSAKIEVRINRERLKGPVRVYLTGVNGISNNDQIRANEDSLTFDDLPSGSFFVQASIQNRTSAMWSDHKQIELAEGDYQTADFGFDKQATVSGLVYWNNEPLQFGRIAMQTSGTGRIYQGGTSDTGNFVIENVEQGTYLIAFFPKDSGRAQMFFHGQDYPHQVEINVGEEDFYDEFYFEDPSGIKGSLSPPPTSTKLAVLRRQTESGDYLQTPYQGDIRKGKFHFEGISTGIYSLHLARQTQGLTFRRLITTDIEVTGDRLVDLGVLPWRHGDSGLRVSLGGKSPPQFLPIEFDMFPQPSRVDGLPTVSGRFGYSSAATDIYDIPSGSYLLKANSSYPAWVIEPSETFVDLAPGNLADVHLDIVPITLLHISSRIKMISVSLTDQVGQIYHFERQQNLQAPPVVFDTQTVILQSRDFHALAANLPEGRYKVEIIVEKGTKVFETLLELGQEKRIDYRGD